MRAVNLLPKDVTRRTLVGRLTRGWKPSVAALIATVGGLVALAALAVALVVTGNSVARKREQLKQQRLELISLTPQSSAPSPRAGAALAGEQSPRVAAVSAALAGRMPLDRVLRRFALVVPNDVWLRTLDLRAPSAAAATAPAGTGPSAFSIAGYTYSHDAVARLLARLALVRDFGDVRLQSSAVTELAGRKVVEFSIVADVRKGASA